MTPEQLFDEFGIEDLKKLTKTKLIRVFTNESGLKITDTGSSSEEGMTMIGQGIETNVYPQYVVFGKVLLMLEKLYYKNTLSIKDKNKINIQGFTVKKVSDDFVTIVLKIIDKQEVTRSDFNNLNDGEKDLYNALLYVSGLHKTNHYKSSSDTVDKLKKRFQLVEGQIRAGNDNDTVLKEFYDLLFKMSNLGIISKSGARQHYKSILKQYF